MSHEEVKCPAEFVCPISMELMTDPVIGSDGHTYQRSAIVEWLSNKNESPLTRKPMSVIDLQPNFALQSMIERWVKENPSAVAAYKKPDHPVVIQDGPFVAKLSENDSMMALQVSSTQQVPLETYLIAVLDVSGSMGSIARSKPLEEGNDFSRLDLVKHSMKTLSTLLSSEYTRMPSSLSIISFSSSAQVVMPLTAMNSAGLKKATRAIDLLEPDGATNIWDGLRLAMAEASSAIDKNPNINVQVLLLTDGEATPGLLPPLGIQSTLKRKISALNCKVTISTFGFGYDLDCDLIEEICEIGNGTYGFIPDCSMVGTVFVNWTTKALLTLAHHLTVKLPNGQTYPIGDIVVGRSQVVVFPKQDIESIELTFDNGTVASIAVQRAIEDITPSLFVEKLKEVVKDIKKCKQFNAVDVTNIVALKNEIAALGLDDSLLRDILRDIQSDDENEGQLLKSVATDEWFKTWGRNHCISYYRALQLQQCVNFKDKVIQHFASAAFKDLQEKALDIFGDLAPPVPSVINWSNPASYNAAVAAHVYNMRNYVNASGGCFTGDSKILMSNGTQIRVAELRKGDIVSGGHKVRAVLYTPIEREFEMISFKSGLSITPWHPMKVSKDGEWVFPQSVGVTSKIHIDGYYNLVLETGHIVDLNGYSVVTLGHGFNDNEVISHSYFGTQSVIEDLKKHPDWESGYLILNPNSTVRNRETGLVEKI